MKRILSILILLIPILVKAQYADNQLYSTSLPNSSKFKAIAPDYFRLPTATHPSLDNYPDRIGQNPIVNSVTHSIDIRGNGVWLHFPDSVHLAAYLRDTTIGVYRTSANSYTLAQLQTKFNLYYTKAYIDDIVNGTTPVTEATNWGFYSNDFTTGQGFHPTYVLGFDGTSTIKLYSLGSNAYTSTAYTPLTNLSGTNGFIQKSTGTGTLANSLISENGNNIAIGDSTLHSLIFRTPSLTQQQITATGTPDGTGFEHANIIFKRDATYNYGSTIDFYTEAKTTANSTDQSRRVGGWNAKGVLDVVTDNIVVGGATIAFPYAPGGTYIGFNAGNLSIPNSTYNTLIGYSTGHGLTTGYNNTFTGFQVGSTATTAYANTGDGIQTLFSLTTGSFNYAGSIHALYSLTTGQSNNAIGAGAMEYLITGSGNNALGMYAGRSYKGSYSLFLGHQAGGLDTTAINGKYNVAFTQDSLYVDGNMIGTNGSAGTSPWMTVNGKFNTRDVDNYLTDISTHYTTRSKIDKGYADGRYAPISGGAYEVPLTFSTGLSRSSNVITVNAAQTQITSVGTLNGLTVSSAGIGIGMAAVKQLDILQTTNTNGVEIARFLANNQSAYTSYGYDFLNSTNTTAIYSVLKLKTNGVTALTVDSAEHLQINITPTTSAGSYDFVTRNSTTGKVEKVASSGLVIPTGTDGKIVGYYDGGVPIAIGRLSVANAKIIFTPTTGGTVNLTNNYRNIINPSGALLALTINLPSSPADGDVVDIKFTQNITTVTYTGGTVVDGITAPTAGGLTVLTYDSGTTSWY